jgi:hypothetical protein
MSNLLKIKFMKRLLIFITLLLSLKSYAQNNLDEVVYLKNGGVVRGTIIEQIPNEKIKIQTADGNIFVYKFDEIEKITKEPKISSRNNSSSINKISPNSTIGNEAIKHRNKGIVCTVLGGTFFAVGMPFLLQGIAGGRADFGNDITLGRLIPGAVLVTTSIPLMIVGPIQLGKFAKLKRESNKGLSFSPDISFHNLTGTSLNNNSQHLSVGGNIKFTF